MFVLISPAKKLNFEQKIDLLETSTPKFLEETKILIEELKKLTPKDFEKLMKLSKDLAQLNYQRYQDFDTAPKKSALFAFDGGTYKGLEAKSFSTANIKYAQTHLGILSGLYGVLAPMDLISPYRLEMGTKFLVSMEFQSLYSFWRPKITNTLNKEKLKTQKFLVNLSSKEYFASVNQSELTKPVITPVFKEKKGDTYKVIGLQAKKARGMMAKFIIQNKLKEAHELMDFTEDGYKYSKKDSNNNELVFKRSIN